MAFDNSLHEVNAVASADLSASQYCAVVDNSSGKAALAGAGLRADGILQDKPTAADQACLVGIRGLSKAKAGAAFNAGVVLTPDASGKLVTAGTGDVPFATSREAAGADGDIVTVLVNPQIPTI